MTDDDKPVFELVTVKKPKELFERGLLAPSMIAHVVVQKFRWGLPFHRQARMLAAQGTKLDDGTMCRYAEDAGATLGCIVEACRKEASNAFCLSTDATGVCIQPEPRGDGRRQACRKGHFFVVLADKDFVFFEYQPKHTSKRRGRVCPPRNVTPDGSSRRDRSWTSSSPGPPTNTHASRTPAGSSPPHSAMQSGNRRLCAVSSTTAAWP